MPLATLYFSFTARFLAVVLCFLSANVSAETDLSFSGFGTLGFSFEEEDNLSLLRDSTQNKQPDKNVSFQSDSQLGLQLSYRFNPQWHATTQFVLADKVDDSLDAATEWAFIGYTPLPSIDIRAGRLALDMFQLSDYRRVDYVNPWVRPPRELYAWITPYSIDGLDLAKSINTGNVYWRMKAQYGSSQPTIETPEGDTRIETELNDFLVLALSAEIGNWQGRLSYARFTTAKSSPGFLPALNGIAMAPGPVGEEANALATILASSSERNVHYWQMGAAYDDGNWILNSELARLSSASAMLPTGTSGYLSAAYRFDDLVPYVSYAKFKPDREPFVSSADWSIMPGISGLRDAALGTINGSMINQETLSLGIRWDFARRMAVKAQWDHTHIRPNGYALWAFDSNTHLHDRTVNVLSFAFNFIF